jgi:putative redox protein
MTDGTIRSVDIERTSVGRYVARNVRGGSISVGTGDEDSFTPVELLLAAIGGCTAIDVDLITSRRAEPSEFSVKVSGDKIRDATGGNRMEHLTVQFTIAFPDGEAGDAAREALPRAVRMSHDRLCTVSRTVELGTPVATAIVSRSSSSAEA